MPQPTPQITSLYRRLLRELPTPPSTIPTRTHHQKLSSPSHLQRRIRSMLSQPYGNTTTTTSTSTSASTSANATTKLHQAEQFIQYVQAQRMYATLLERYNPGMGMSEEEKVRLSARKVGMDLPVEFVMGEEEGEGERR